MAEITKNTKLRQVERKNLPFGKFKYIVNFNLTMFNFHSTKYNLYRSEGTLLAYISKSQQQRVMRGMNKNTRQYRSSMKQHNKLLDIDLFVDDFKDTIIGKYRISFNIRRRLPLKVYFTDYEDITYLYFNYRKFIGRIMEVTAKTT